MNADQIALTMITLVEAYSRGDLTSDQFTGITVALGNDAQARGIDEAVKSAYRELTWKKHQDRLHNYEAPANG